MKTNHREAIIYAAIILAQIAVLLYWARVKTNFYIDELYSMGYASSFTETGDTAQYITTSPEWRFDRWIENAELKKYLLLSDEERVFAVPFLTAVRRFLTKGNYFGLLNMAESIAGVSSVTQWPALVLNIILFVLAQGALVALMRKLGMERRMQYCALAMFGFSGYMISAVEYVRFYILVITLALLMLNLCHRLWHAERWKEMLPAELGLLVLSYLAYKNSELTVAYVGGLVLCLGVASFFQKKRNLLFFCMGFCLLGLIYIAVATDYIDALFLSQKADGQALAAALHIRNVSLRSVKDYVIWLKRLFETLYVSRYWMSFLLAGAVTVCLLLPGTERESEGLRVDMRNIRPVTAGAFCVWLALFCLIHLFNHDRGAVVCLFMMAFAAVCAVIEGSGHSLRVGSVSCSSDTRFVLILLGASAIYTFFEAMASHKEWRYYCYGFVSFSVITWYAMDRLLKRRLLRGKAPALRGVLAVCVALNALIPFKTRGIEYMYEKDRAFVDTVENFYNSNVVLFVPSTNLGPSLRHVLYDCVNLLPEDSRIRVVDMGSYDYAHADYPREFVLWTHVSSDVSAVLDDMRAHGYAVTELGADHVSKAWTCTKQ